MDGRTVAIGGGALGALALLIGALATGRAEPRESFDTETGQPLSSSPAATAPPDPAPDDRLLPDLRSLDAFDLQIEATPAGRRLRFAAALANDGPGPAGPQAPRPEGLRPGPARGDPDSLRGP